MRPSSHLILWHPLFLLLPIPPSIRVFSNESTLRMSWPKYWGFSFSIIPSKEHPGLISFRMDWLDLLAVQEPMQYCFLQHRTLLLWPVTSTTGYCFCFGSIPSFFLELFLYWCGLFFSVLSFRLFILFMGFSRQEYWSGLPFPSPVDNAVFSTMTRPSWVALHSMAHSFIELDKTVVHMIRLVGLLWWWFSVCLPSDQDG